MLKNEPLWRFTARAPLTRWYEHVRLLPDRVIGQWFCLDRSSGMPIWEQRLERPDEIVGIASGVIISLRARSERRGEGIPSSCTILRNSTS